MNSIKVIQTRRAFGVFTYQVIKEQRNNNRGKVEIIYSGFNYIKAMRAGHAARTKDYPLFEIITK